MNLRECNISYTGLLTVKGSEMFVIWNVGYKLLNPLIKTTNYRANAIKERTELTRNITSPV